MSRSLVNVSLAASFALVSLVAVAPLVRALAPGAAAPEIALADLNGSSIKLSGLRGKVVLVDFWASWCGPCREELPWLEQLYAKLRARGFEIVAVNQDERADNAKKFVRAHPVTFPVVHDLGGKVADRYAPAKMPSSYVIDKKGRVRFVHAGFRAADEKAIEAEIERLLGESDKS